MLFGEDPGDGERDFSYGNHTVGTKSRKRGTLHSNEREAVRPGIRER